MSKLPEHIKVWAFNKAPEELQDLSENGGDEDWVAVVPGGMTVPAFLEGSTFGCCTVQKIEHWSGATVVIGCHA